MKDLSKLPHAIKDQAYICPVCKTRFLGYRIAEDFSEAIDERLNRRHGRVTCGKYECWDKEGNTFMYNRIEYFASLKRTRDAGNQPPRDEWE